MGIENRFADTRTAQERRGSIETVIPATIVEELDIEHQDQILFEAEEGEDVVRVRPCK